MESLLAEFKFNEENGFIHVNVPPCTGNDRQRHSYDELRECMSELVEDYNEGIRKMAG